MRGERKLNGVGKGNLRREGRGGNTKMRQQGKRWKRRGKLDGKWKGQRKIKEGERVQEEEEEEGRRERKGRGE